MAGQNHGILEALQTVQKLIEGEDISSQAADQMLAFPETRAVAEELADINFSGELPARDLLHAWQKIHRADLEQAVWKSHESKQLNKPREEMPDSDDAFFELLRELPDPDGSFKQALESHRLKKLAEEFAENAQQIQDGSLTARELALQMVENGEKGGPSAQTYKKALLSKLERVGASETPYDVPLYRRAAGIHRVIADNLQNLQRQQIAEAAQQLQNMVPEYTDWRSAAHINSSAETGNHEQYLSLNKANKKMVSEETIFDDWQNDNTPEGFIENKEQHLQNTPKSYIMTGARITDPFSERANAHAANYYGLIRSMKTDIERISKNTGYSPSEIERIKNYLFMDVHDLGEGQIKTFDPDCAIAQSWQRLLEGKPEPHDLTLLKHEIMEKQLMEDGLTQDEAHRITSQKYNYSKEVKEFYANFKKHQD